MSVATPTVLVDHSDTEWTLHLPSSEHWMEPVCGAGGNWLDKPEEMYPHYVVCEACAEQRSGEVSDR